MRLYEGTKHSFATHLEAEEVVVQHIFWHADVRNPRRYRPLKDSAVVEVLGRNLGGREKRRLKDH